MPADSPYPAPFDTATFLFPAEWHTFSDLLGGVDTGLMCLREGRILHVNTHLAQQLGFDEGELNGRPLEFLLPENNAGGGDWHAADPEDMQVRLIAKSGRAMRFHLISNRIDTLSDGSCTIWVLKPETAASREDEARQLQAVAANLPDPVVVCGEGTVIAFASRAFEDATGESSGTLSECVHMEDKARLIAAVGEASGRAPGAFPLSFRLRHRDGSWRHMSALACRLADEPDSVLVSMRDMTQEWQQRQATEAGRKRQLHYLNRLLHLAQHPHANRESALKVILKCAAKAIGVQRCALWEATEDPPAMRCAMAYDDVRQNFLGDGADAAPQALLLQAMRGGGQFAVDDVDRDPRTVLHCEYFHAAGVKALMAAPVQAGAQPAGLLMFSMLGQTRHWRREETDFAAHAAELVAQIYRQVELNRDEAQSRQLAHHDNLTGLPNRHFLFDQAADLLPKETAGAAAVALFFINLDRFKNINDSFGHAVGDELLKAAAMRLRNAVRKDDILARLGGDEFMLFARKVSDMRIAGEIAQQIVEAMRGAFSLKGREVQVSASVGVAIYPFDGGDIDTLARKAETALVQAKSSGRDQYRMFGAQGGGARRSMLETELRQALDERELLHYYQPQIELRTGRVCCVEALLRWRHPRLGLVLPSTFLPVAEETGLIRRISHWVMNDICQQMNAWIGQGMDDFKLAINLSASQLADKSLLPALENALERTGVPAECLEWEIKESTVMQHQTMASSLLDRLTDLRIGLSIDDFGTGYSNMAYLRHYPVRKVKIDASFVDGLPGEKDDRAITDAIISMAKPLGLDVVAEGVETPQQMEYLRERGCDIAQGYFFTQPLTAEQFETWLIRH